MSAPSIYLDAVAAGIPVDHHESDLYMLATPESRALVAKHGLWATPFKSHVDGKAWLDVPFAYDPFWEARAAQ